VGIFVLRILTFLPYRQQMRLGRTLGRILSRILPDRRKIAAVNLRLCFPDLDAADRRTILREHFESLGMGVFEIALAIWISDKRVAKLVNLKGIDNIQKSLDEGHGVLVVSGHFPATELTGRAIRLQLSVDAAIYRPMENPLMDELVRRARLGAARYLITKSDVRKMVRALKAGSTIWYASDQSYNRKYSVMVPFFNQPAMTNAALTHIARISGAAVMLYFPTRLPNDAGYYGEVFPRLENFPTDDPAADALRINQLLEEHIRKAPAEYYWIHRRFKGRPEPYPDPYTESDENDLD
jgi:KDO2-lipid IV(A) lauroyltransferase